MLNIADTWTKVQKAIEGGADDCEQLVIDLFPDLVKELEQSRIRIATLELDLEDARNEIQILKEE